jgi:integrase
MTRCEGPEPRLDLVLRRRWREPQRLEREPELVDGCLLRWREDVDMVARTITVNLQSRNGVVTTPKGRTRRSVPMTATLHDALKRMQTIREGFALRRLDGSLKTDNDADTAIRRICRRAGLPVRYFHVLCHTFGTHVVLFGVNPWRLQVWLGRLDPRSQWWQRFRWCDRGDSNPAKTSHQRLESRGLAVVFVG